MRRLLLPLLALSVLTGARQDDPPAAVVGRWIDAVLAHQPGQFDQPLEDVAGLPPTEFAVVARKLEKTLEDDFATPEARNDVRRRGALLHTDIALLLPDRAALFRGAMALLPTRGGDRTPEPGKLVRFEDGAFVEADVECGHWPLARWLLDGITPRPASDEFVRLWYRAIAARFLLQVSLGTATPHLRRAREVLPQDPLLLFYAGAMHESLASPWVQNVPDSAPALLRRQDLRSEEDHLRDARRLLREAVRHGAPPEAHLRLGRVTGRLGEHADAAALLSQIVPPAGDARLTYFRELFLGSELGALGRLEEARASFDRAATLFPTAQAPLIAMSDMLRRSGDRAAALDALRRLEHLPEGSARTDPWWNYHRSHVADAEDQLALVRAWVGWKDRP